MFGENKGYILPTYHSGHILYYTYLLSIASASAEASLSLASRSNKYNSEPPSWLSMKVETEVTVFPPVQLTGREV